MPNQTRTLLPGPDARSARTPEGQVLHPPADWVLVPPGDPGLTRRIKAAGPSWTVQEKKGRKTFSQGVWASAATVAAIKADLAAERATPEYAHKQAMAAQRHEREQGEYVLEFTAAVLSFLRFQPQHATLAGRLAHAVAAHATPVGSGTVARTERIGVHQRAEAAVIAWMRHQTTVYDHMTFAREKGKRREVRRMLAARSNALLDTYRTGRAIDPSTCPLQRALKSMESAA